MRLLTAPRAAVRAMLCAALLAACSLLAPGDETFLGGPGAGGDGAGDATGGAAAGDGAASTVGGAQSSAAGSSSGDGGSSSAAAGSPADAGEVENGACGAGEKNCSGCVPVTDPAYGCGSFDCAPCALPHADAACAGDSCVIASCRAPWADTNELPGDGCEAPTIPVAGLLLWLAADEGLTHLDGEVSAWADQSGNANHAVALGDNTPALVQRAGLPWPGVEFNGAGDGLRIPQLTSFDGLGVYVVGEVFAGAACARLLQLATADASVVLDVGQQESAPYYRFGEASMLGGAGELPSDAPFLFAVLHYRNDNASMRANGAFVQTNTFAYPVGQVFAENFIGFDAAEACSLRGRIFELMVYNFPTNDERPQIEGYLQSKWGCCAPPLE